MSVTDFDISWCSWSFLNANNLSPDNFCIQCKKILKEPMLLECCGSHICKLCAKALLQSGKLSLCANCNEKFVACIVDKNKWRHILDLKIFCPLQERGCQWSGDIRRSCNHLSSECQYMSIDCTAGCGVSVERCELTDHLINVCPNRLSVCQYCGKEGQFDTINNCHLLICSQYYVLCHNGCGEKILQSSFSEHLNKCSEFAIPCFYHFTGCDTILKRKLIHSHLLESTQNHSFLLSKHVSQNLQISASKQHEQMEVSQKTRNYFKELAQTKIDQSAIFIERAQLKSAHQIDNIIKKKNLKVQECKYKLTQLSNNLEKTMKGMFVYTPDALWEVNSTDIHFKFMLNSGQFTELWTGNMRENQITIKKHKTGSITSSKFLQEALVLKRFDHEHILQLVGVSSMNTPIMIVMEYAAQTLQSFLKKKSGQLTIVMQNDFILQISSGMAYIESLHCIHRALNSNSVLMGSNLQCKIGNFMFARILENEKTEYQIPQGERIPIKWSPPEALLHNKFTKKSDVWAFGILQHEIITRCPMKMCNTLAEAFIKKGYELDCPPNCPKEYYQLINECLNKDPESRPTFAAFNLVAQNSK